jgi:hypothetical protein
MIKKNNYEGGFGSDAVQAPQRIVFITRKTSAKVTGVVGPRLMSYPHVVLREMIAFEVLTVFMVLLALFWDAPLEQVANPLLTPNPAKAPWYFLGLQELLHYFPPVVAGVAIPTMVIVALVVIPYFNVNIAGAPLWAGAQPRRLWLFAGPVSGFLAFCAFYRAWTIIVPTAALGGLAVAAYFIRDGRRGFAGFLRSRTLPWWIMTWFILVAIILTEVGTFFRGPGWSWVWPWR